MNKIILISAEKFMGEEYVKEFNIKNPKILFITTASEVKDGEKPWLEDAKNALITAGCELTIYDIRNKTLEDFREEIINYDAIHFSSGHPQFLLYYIKKTGFDIFLKECNKNMILSGSSAGAVVLSQSIESSLPWEGILENYPLNSYEGLKYVSFEILPHFGREKYIEKQIECIKHSMSINSNVMCLNDDSMIVIENRSFKIIKK